MLRKTDSSLLDRGTRTYFFEEAFFVALKATRLDFFRPVRNATEARPELLVFPGALIMERTAATRSDLRPKNSPISSGVGTELLMTCTLIRAL
jgi:hypothetical protein